MAHDIDLGASVDGGLNHQDRPYEDPSANPRQESEDSRRSGLFFHIGFVACIILQRFGFQLGDSDLFISLPIFLFMACWAVNIGIARIDLTTAMFYLALLLLVSLSIFASSAFPDDRVSVSLLSPIAIMLNCMMYVFAPGRRFDGRRGIDIFLLYARICAGAGLAQYLLQFVGIRLFSFATMFPFFNPILVERHWNAVAITAYGSTEARANGFFLLEPSIFSQMMIIAIVIEFFVLNRLKFLPLYAAAYVVSQSGTGAVSFLLAVPLYIGLFSRESGRMMMFVVVGVVGLIAMGLLFPDQLQGILGRSTELGMQGSSGYARYVEQFNSVAAVSDEWRSFFIGFGPGAAERASFIVKGSAGIVQKMTIDYGILALLIYIGMTISAFWRWDLSMTSPLVLVIMLVGGGYVVLSPMIVLLLLITNWPAPRQLDIAPRLAPA